jgi:hypothetical protein
MERRSRPFIARFDGWCPLCDHDFYAAVGMVIFVAGHDRPVHVHCAAEAECRAERLNAAALEWDRQERGREARRKPDPPDRACDDVSALVDLLGCLTGVRSHSTWWTADCPACRQPNTLTVAVNADGTHRVECRGGWHTVACDPDAVHSAVDDLERERRHPEKPLTRVEQWIVDFHADGQKHPLGEVIEAAIRAGFTRNQVLHARRRLVERRRLTVEGGES